MNPSKHARSFRDLNLYKKTRAVGAKIADTWARRRRGKHIVSNLTDAKREQEGTQHWIDTAATFCGEHSSSSLFTLHESAENYFTTGGDGQESSADNER